MEFLHPAMWHLALESWQWIHQVAAPCFASFRFLFYFSNSVKCPCNVIHDSVTLIFTFLIIIIIIIIIMMSHVALGSWHWVFQVAAPCNVAGGSGMKCHWIRPNVPRIWIIHLVSISTISLQSTCHSAPVCEVLSQSDHPRQKKMTSYQFSIFKMADLSHLGFYGSNNGFFEKPVLLPIGRQ